MVRPRELYDAFMALGYYLYSESSSNWLVHHQSQADPFECPKWGNWVNITTLDKARAYEPRLNV